jgi:hypothetical protein
MGNMKRREFLSESLATIGLLSTGGLGAFVGEVKRVDDKHFITTILRVDHVNANRRIYPKSVIEKAVANFEHGSVLGELWDGNGHHRKDVVIKFANVSHEVKNIYLEDDYLKAEILILDTPRGKILDSIKDISFRPFGFGRAKVNENGNVVIGDDYKLIGVDAMPTSMAVKL